LSELSAPIKRRVKAKPKESERKQPAEKTKKTRDLLDNIIESSLDSIVLTDKKGYVTSTNKSFLELLGYTNENQVIGKHVAEFSPIEAGTYDSVTGELVHLDKEFLDSIITVMSKLTKEGKISNLEFYLIRSDKKVVSVEENIVNLYNKKGERTGTLGVIRDITERKKYEEALKKSEEKYQNLIENANDAIISINREGIIVTLNKKVEEMYGYNREELLGKSVILLVPPHRREAQKKALENLKTIPKVGGFRRTLEAVAFGKDGKEFPVETSMFSSEIHGEHILTSFVRDITERKKADKELEATKDYLDNIVQSSLDAIVISDDNGYVTNVNQAFLELLGYKEKEEVIGRFMAEFSPTEVGIYESTTRETVEINKEFFDDVLTQIHDKLWQDGKITNWEVYLIHKNNKVIPVEENITYLINRKGEQIGAVGVIRNITERKKAEKELRETKDFLEEIIENSKDGILVVDDMGYILSCNTAVEQMSGFGKEKIIGKHASALTIDDKNTRKKILEKIGELFEKGFATYDAKYKSKEGKYLDVECTSSMISNEKGEHIAGVSIIRDVSERKKAEREIREGKEFLEKIIKGSKDGILIGDGEGYILSANEAMEEMLDLSKDEIVGKHSSELLLDDKAEREKVLKKMGELFENGFVSYETRYKGKNDDYIEVECHLSMIKDEKGDYIAGVSMIRDITERKKMQRQLLQSEKLRSLGELAGGVAHDFNNVLAAILGRAQLLKMQFTPPPGKQEKRKSMLDLIKSLEIIERASSDGAETVRRIQEFSRKRSDDKDFTQININELLDNALEFTGVRWKDDAESKGIKVTIQKEFSSLPTTLGSAAELREVFTNIINNALDAMPQGGRIQIKTFKKNNHISIRIKDTGVGIPEDIRNRIFDPFFTTKGVQSTGLGMSTSYGIINRHKGTIAVDSTEGKGTTFTINIPIAKNKLEAEEKIKPILDEKRKATILVIEDEEEVRNLLADILIESGHHVETASDGSQGIETFKDMDFDMVFTDLGMAGVSGWEVAETVKKINRKIPVAIITGWNVEMEESEMRERGVNLIAHKPFEVNQILRLVQEGMELRKQFDAA
jgi:PAS domain S-box-containing protein